jgi:hypothetical protein
MECEREWALLQVTICKWKIIGCGFLEVLLEVFAIMTKEVHTVPDKSNSESGRTAFGNDRGSEKEFGVRYVLKNICPCVSL